MSNPFYKSKFWRDLRREALERDRYRCTIRGCKASAATSRLYVDHREPRPYTTLPCAEDHIDNLRTLCEQHDNAIRQDRNGQRRSGGKTVVLGCDADGVPLDPSHHWRA